MAVIKDAVHGEIALTDFEAKLLDAPEMQRLRRVKQLAVTNLVYPGANHSRFEHSLGTMHLAGRISEKLCLNEKQTIRAAALLHDVGHAAFSHEIEELLKQLTGKTHEEIGREKIESGFLKEVIEANGFSPREISETIKGKGVGEIISSQLGADRMDYLQRDAHYTGVAYGVIDAGRLIQTMRFAEKRICIEEGGLEAAESLLIARFLMFSAVYLHHTVRIASSMLRKAVELALLEKTITMQDIFNLDDAQLASKLREDKSARGLINGIDNRQLYKRACEFAFEQFTEEGKKAIENASTRGRIEKEISEKTGSHVLLDYSTGYWSSGGKNVKIMSGGEYVELEKASEIIKSLETAEKKRLTLLVVCPKEKIETVKKTAEKTLAPLLI